MALVHENGQFHGQRMDPEGLVHEKGINHGQEKRIGTGGLGYRMSDGR